MDDFKKYLNENRDSLDADTPRDAVWQRIQQTTRPVVKQLPTNNWLYTAMKFVAAASVVIAIVAGIKYLSNTDSLIGQQGEVVSIKDHVAKTDDTVLLTREKVNNLPQKMVPQQKQPVKKIVDVKQSDYASKRKTAPVMPQVPVRIRKKGPAATSPDDMAIITPLQQSYAQLISLQLNRLRTTPVFAESPKYFDDFKVQLKQMDADEAAIKKEIKTNGLNDALLDQLINVSQQRLNLLKNLQTEINKMNNRVRQNQLPQDSTHSYFLNI
ncbi:MAG: hypothetical protein V4722_04590 [Bacteroidota bacterium]